MLQLGLRTLQPVALCLWQGLAGAVDVEGEHRKRGTIGAGLAPLALFCRSLERCRDLFRVGEREDASFQIERIAFARDPLRPAIRSCRSLLPRGPGFPARRTG